MSRATLRPGLLIAVVGAVALVMCVAAPRWFGGIALVVELFATGLLGAWSVLAARYVARARALERCLYTRSVPAALAGVDCRIVAEGGSQAFVVGAWRPRIYIGDALLDTLDREELEAVLWHEDYHRRTRAPLRTAAIEAWMALLGHWQPVCGPLVDRLGDLEVAADADALRRGASPDALAGALVKSERGRALSVAAFAASPDRRLRALLGRADGEAANSYSPLPYEWLPVAAALVMVLACPGVLPGR